MSTKSKMLGFKLARPIVAAVFSVARGANTLATGVCSGIKFAKNEVADFGRGVKGAIHNRGDHFRID